MTKAAMQVEENFIDCGPIDNAVACHYFKKTIWHVGIVEGGMVRHTGRQYGTTQHKISEFEKLAPKTIYKIHKSLCRN